MEGNRPAEADDQREQCVGGIDPAVEQVLKSFGGAPRARGYRHLLRRVERLRRYRHATWSYQVRDLEPDIVGHDGPPEWDLDARTRERHGHPSGWRRDGGWPFETLENTRAHYWLRWFSLRPYQRKAIIEFASGSHQEVNLDGTHEDDLFTEADLHDIFGQGTNDLCEAPFPGVAWHQVMLDPRISVGLDRASAPDELLDRLVVPSSLDFSVKGRGTYPGAYGLCPYLLAHLVGGLTDPGDMVWEVTLADAPVAGLVCSVLGRESARLLPANGEDQPALMALPVHEGAGIGPHAGDHPRHGKGIKSPSVVVVHLPLAVDAWSIMAHYLCHGIGLTWHGLGNHPADHPEMAINDIKLAAAIRQRLQVVDRHLRTHGRHDGTFVAVSTPIQGLWPRWSSTVAQSLGWYHRKDIRVYEAAPPQVGGSNRQHAPHPGNGSPLPPKLVSIWEVAR